MNQPTQPNTIAIPKDQFAICEGNTAGETRLE